MTDISYEESREAYKLVCLERTDYNCHFSEYEKQLAFLMDRQYNYNTIPSIRKRIFDLEGIFGMFCFTTDVSLKHYDIILIDFQDVEKEFKC